MGSLTQDVSEMVLYENRRPALQRDSCTRCTRYRYNVFLTYRCTAYWGRVQVTLKSFKVNDKLLHAIDVQIREAIFYAFIPHPVESS